MLFYKNIIITLLLIGSLFCNTFATENGSVPFKSETELSPKKILKQRLIVSALTKI